MTKGVKLEQTVTINGDGRIYIPGMVRKDMKEYGLEGMLKLSYSEGVLTVTVVQASPPKS